jgi:hypothetical protein
MLSYYKLWDAKRRLVESNKTVAVLQPDVPPMIKAQNDMLGLEVDYYRFESKKFTVFAILTIFVISSIMVFLMSKGYINV